VTNICVIMQAAV